MRNQAGRPLPAKVSAWDEEFEDAPEALDSEESLAWI